MVADPDEAVVLLLQDQAASVCAQNVGTINRIR